MTRVSPSGPGGPHDPEAVQEVVDLMSAMSRTSVALSADISAELGVHPTDVNALHLLAAAVEPVTASELGAALALSSAATTGLVDRLVREGLAERRDHPDDRRKVIVVATERATELSLQHLAPLLDRVGRAIGEADADALAAVIRFLRRVTGDDR
ncbi:MAG: MarR family transcriptional regulator [Actinomycetota bacterium]